MLLIENVSIADTYWREVRNVIWLFQEDRYSVFLHEDYPICGLSAHDLKLLLANDEGAE